MKKFKVGDIVNFDYGGKKGQGKIVEINSGHYRNNYLIELFGGLKRTGHNGLNVSKEPYTTNDYWYIPMSSKKISLANYEEIHITRKAQTVHAVMKNNGEVIRRSKAVCSPEDEFDFKTGTKLAFERLFEELKPCPFCGRKDTLIITNCVELKECKNFEECEFDKCKTICCDVNKGGCGAASGYAIDESRVIEMWNRRISNEQS